MHAVVLHEVTRLGWETQTYGEKTTMNTMLLKLYVNSRIASREEVRIC